MEFVNAFILAGVICVIFQLLLMYTKLGVPRILILGLGIGSILGASGIMETLTAWGGGGMLIMVVAAGTAIFQGIIAALSGNFAVIISFLYIICVLAIIGIVAALAYLKIDGTQAKG